MGTVPAMKPAFPGAEPVAGESNAPTFTPPAEITEEISGEDIDCEILVYTDDCSGNNPLLAALAERGLGYVHLFQNPSVFEMAVATEYWSFILIDHCCYMDLSLAWDDLRAAYLAGSSIAVASYDWDGSHDESGGVSSFLALGGTSHAHDVPTQGEVHLWNPSSLFAGLPSPLPVGQNFYVDEGDAWTSMSAEAGWTPAPRSGEGAAKVASNLVLMGFLPCQLSPGHGRTVWRNVIGHLLTGGPVPVTHTTWSAIKALYR
jgi:hypothetical protein